MEITIIGIDCATVPEKTGLARGRFDDGKVRIEGSALGSKEMPVARTVAAWIQGGHPGVLLALDAPLGWPLPLARVLDGHEAGRPIDTEPDDMFRRATDNEIKRRIGKVPLEVGADRIARTAHAALKLLQELRDETRLAVPLAWAPAIVQPSAIEVYPAATLAAHLGRAARYKQGRADRPDVLRLLEERIDVSGDAEPIDRSDDVLDAVVCVLAGADFLQAKCIGPKNEAVARKEGWIWVRERG